MYEILGQIEVMKTELESGMECVYIETANCQYSFRRVFLNFVQ